MNTLSQYRLPDFLCGSFGGCLLLTLSVLTCLLALTHLKNPISEAVLILMMMCTLGMTAFVTLHRKVYITEGLFYVKDQDDGGFIPITPGYYTFDGYIGSEDILFQKISRKIVQHSGNTVVDIQYFAPVTKYSDYIKMCAVFEADCREYCRSTKDFRDLADYWGVEGFHIIATR